MANLKKRRILDHVNRSKGIQTWEQTAADRKKVITDKFQYAKSGGIVDNG